MKRHRPLLSLLAGAAGLAFVGHLAGTVVGVLAGAVTWVTIGRAEPAHLRRSRDATRRELPALVRLIAAGLQGGASVPTALRAACEALPGAAADALSGVAARLELGVDPEVVWSSMSGVAGCEPLGRALARSQQVGGSVVAATRRLADELERRAQADVEDRARTVGVKAALPLGLCLLPAFLLMGVVPMVAGMVRSLQW